MTESHMYADFSTRFAGLRVLIQANLVYQQNRLRVMELRDGGIKLLSLVLASSVVAQLSQHDTALVWWILLGSSLVAVVGNGMSLVFNWGGKARDASQRAIDWARLDAEVRAKPPPVTEQDLAAWNEKAALNSVGEAPKCEPLWCRSEEEAARLLGVEFQVSASRWTRYRPVIFVS